MLCLLKFEYYCMSLQERDTTACSLELLIFIVDVADSYFWVQNTLKLLGLLFNKDNNLTVRG